MPRGGARKGAGKKKGTKHKKTIEREVALEMIRQRVMGSLKSLVDAQFSLAKGQAFLYRIDTRYEGKKRVKDKPVLVTSQEEISSYLNGEYDGEGDSYYYITTKEPNNLALDSLLNRTFGKPIESVEVSGKNGGPISLSELFDQSRKTE